MHSHMVKGLGISIAYIALTKLVIQLAALHNSATILWLPGGMALAALLAWGIYFWPYVFLGATLGGLYVDHTLLSALSMATGNTLETVVATYVLQHKTSFDVTLQTPKDYLYLGLVGAAAALISALIGPATLLFFHSISPANYLTFFFRWWQADIIGILFATPSLLIWRVLPRGWFSSPLKTIESFVLFGLCIVISGFLYLDWFSTTMTYKNMYWEFVLLIWVAIRRGVHGVVLMLLITGTMAIWGALCIKGYYANDLILTGMNNLWLFMIAMSITGFTFAISAQQQLDNLQRYKTVLFNSPVPMMISQENGIITFLNPSFIQHFGYTLEDVPTIDLLIQNKLFQNSTAPYLSLENSLTALKKTHSNASPIEVKITCKQGETRYAQLRAIALNPSEPASNEILYTLADITPLKDYQQQLQTLVNFDPLTNIPNRHYFYEQAQQLIQKCEQKDKRLALLFMDLNGFKEVNDNHGHAIGDEVLKIMAKRFQHELRKQDIIARIGGDEFVILIYDIDHGIDLEHILNRIRHSASDPLLIHELMIRLSTSIGQAIFPNDARELSDLLKIADHAMYQAKRQHALN